jgi:hypothetical protein
VRGISAGDRPENDEQAGYLRATLKTGPVGADCAPPLCRLIREPHAAARAGRLDAPILKLGL